jgi:hypothetical protein
VTWRELALLAALSARAGVAPLRDLYLNLMTAAIARHTEN